ncbi:MAG: hypothetical protein RID93_36855 [Sandaracinaceae bacterium]
MRSRLGLLPFFSLLLLPLTAHTASAQSACGDIYLASTARCEVLIGGGCTAMCEPFALEATCAADLYASCDGTCTATAEASCEASCDVAACEATCTVDPGSYDCRADCQATVEASCEAECAGMAGDMDAQARCEASCRSTYAGSCDASCEATPPSADCMARCEASCQGRCEAEANVDCQVDCQADGYVDCYATVEGGCEAECTEPSGALFCDGQYVDVEGGVDACIMQLRDRLDIEVDTSARGTAMCMDGECMAEGEASISCAAVPGRSGGYGFAMLLLAGAGAFFNRPR